jgi:hypothetical protein
MDSSIEKEGNEQPFQLLLQAQNIVPGTDIPDDGGDRSKIRPGFDMKRGLTARRLL